jgi:hypothetical protein
MLRSVVGRIYYVSTFLSRLAKISGLLYRLKTGADHRDILLSRTLTIQLCKMPCEVPAKLRVSIVCCKHGSSVEYNIYAQAPDNLRFHNTPLLAEDCIRIDRLSTVTLRSRSRAVGAPGETRLQQNPSSSSKSVGGTAHSSVA